MAATGERERRNLAVALHDRIGQALAFTRINLDLIRRSLRDDDAAEQIDHVLSVVDQISSDTQSLIFDLNPPVLSLLGLGPAVEWLAEGMQQEHKLRIVVTHEGEPDPLPDDVRNLLFRAVRELLTNVVKHSRSPTARVVVRRASRKIQVLVEDDGVEMSPGKLESAKGFGLFSIRERLHELGGSLKINSKPGATRVRIEVPLALAGDTKSHGRTRN